MFHRSFFSAFFEPASSSPIGNRILYSNHSMKLLVLIGFLRNLQKSDLNLPDISCSGSPLLCLCVKKFLFCNCFHVFVSFWTETYFFIGIFFLLWFAKIDALSITHVESRFNRLCLVSSCHGSMVPRWWIMSNFSGTKRIGTFPKHNLNSELSIFAYLNWLWPRNVEKNDLTSMP